MCIIYTFMLYVYIIHEIFTLFKININIFKCILYICIYTYAAGERF